MHIKLDNQQFKKIIILFWALWWLITFWTDVVGGLAQLSILNASWTPNNNYPYLVKCLQMYPLPDWVPGLLYVGIIFCSGISAYVFCWASSALGKSSTVWMSRARTAFIITMIYWCAFFLADQMVMQFDLEQNHMVQGGFELLSFLALYILQD